MPGFAENGSDEKEQLLAYLAQQRHMLGLASHGLSDGQARMTPSARRHVVPADGRRRGLGAHPVDPALARR